MATKLYTRMSSGGVVRFEVFMEYDDTNWRVINDDGEPDDFRVARWFGTNYSDAPFSIDLLVDGGRKWKSFDLAPGAEFSHPAGGRVKYEGDIDEWRYG